MAKKTLYGKLLAVLVCSMVLIMPSAEVFANGRGNAHKRGNEIVRVGHHTYHYRNGRFYRPSWFGFQFIIHSPPIGAVVTLLPLGHKTIVVGGLTYYYYEDIYYTTCPSGYVVVPAPVVKSTPVVVASGKQSGETIVINVPNYTGGYTPVALTKQGDGYVGPQGEYYAGNPTVEQLRVLYGK